MKAANEYSAYARTERARRKRADLKSKITAVMPKVNNITSAGINPVIDLSGFNSLMIYIDFYSKISVLSQGA
jgi:hypothetical protein